MTGPERAEIGTLINEVRSLRVQVETLDTKLDDVVVKVSKAEGVLALFRWLGAASTFAIVGAVIYMNSGN